VVLCLFQSSTCLGGITLRDFVFLASSPRDGGSSRQEADPDTDEAVYTCVRIKQACFGHSSIGRFRGAATLGKGQKVGDPLIFY
jgi:hypothetical protein